MAQINKPLETSTRTLVDNALQSLGWRVDESQPNAQVFQEHPKTKEEQRKLHGKKPDYVLYLKDSPQSIAVIETKRPGRSLGKALDQGKQYAISLGARYVFVTDGIQYQAWDTKLNDYLKIDGATVKSLLPAKTLQKFIEAKNVNITNSPITTSLSKDDVQKIFKRINNLLRKEGIRSGEERFSAIADLLFLKLSESNPDLGSTIRSRQILSKEYSWSALKQKSATYIANFLNDSIRPRLINLYGDVFRTSSAIKSGEILLDIIQEIDKLAFASQDFDLKGEAFEFFLKSMTNANKDLGEYYTPRHIIQAMISIVQPKYGWKIYDPFAGTGGFLIESFKYLIQSTDASHNPDIFQKIRQESLYGRELTSTARIAKMNMILFGDGATNISQIDSYANPINLKFDLAISNIPYSQETEYGSYYGITNNDGDAIGVAHLWKSLKDGGTLAAIVPEPVLYESGPKSQKFAIRKEIIENSESIIVISLPRGVFNPYTPVKTSVIIAKKHLGSMAKLYKGIIIDNDGFELGARRRPLRGRSDLANIPFWLESQKTIPNKVVITNSFNKDYSLLPYSYMEDIPKSARNGVRIEKLTKNVTDSAPRLSDRIYDLPENSKIVLLEVSQNGIYPSETFTAEDPDILDYLKHKIVFPNQIVFNPHRINVGSIGLVPELDGTFIVSPIYEVLDVKDDDSLTKEYIVKMLKSKTYLSVLNHYAIGGARPLVKYNQLKRIVLPRLNEQISKKLGRESTNLIEARKNLLEQDILFDKIILSILDN